MMCFLFYFSSQNKMNMNYFDIIVGIILILAIIKGFKNGLIIEFASLSALVLGLLGAVKFSSITESWLIKYMQWEHIGIVAFLLTFVIIVICVHLVARVTDKFIKAVALGVVNRIFGALFSLLKYAFVISVLVSVITGLERNFKIIPDHQKESSFLYEPISSIAPMIFPYLRFEGIKEQVSGVTRGTEV